MKTAVKYILVLSLLFLLCSCNHAAEPEVSTQPSQPQRITEPTTVPTEPTEPFVPVEQAPMLALSLPIHTERIVDSGTVVYEHISQDMNLFMAETDVADRIILDFLARTDTIQFAQKIGTWAKEDYSAFPEDWVKYLCQSTYGITRFDSAVLSLYGTHIRFADINMSEGYNDAVTYDMTTGLILDLPDVLPAISREELTELIIDSLSERQDALQLYPEFPEVVTDRFTGSLSNDKAWYLSNNGLCFYFTAYEIAPGASGVITVEIPYSELAGKMNDAYFPPEQEATAGQINAIVSSDENMAMFTQFAEIKVSTSDRKVLLYTDQSVANLQIELGSKENGAFHSEHTVFATPVLTPGDAVLLECSEGSADKLRISYERNQQTEFFFISISSDSIGLLPVE